LSLEAVVPEPTVVAVVLEATVVLAAAVELAAAAEVAATVVAEPKLSTYCT